MYSTFWGQILLLLLTLIILLLLLSSRKKIHSLHWHHGRRLGGFLEMGFLVCGPFCVYDNEDLSKVLWELNLGSLGSAAGVSLSLLLLVVFDSVPALNTPRQDLV